MTILHIIHNMEVGGAQTTLYNLVKSLKDEQHIVLTYKTNEQYVTKLSVMTNVRLIIVFDLKSMFVSLRSLSFDIVHYHWWPQLKVCYHYFHRQNKPIVLTLQEQCIPPKNDDVYYVAGSHDNFRFIKNMKRKQIIYLGIDPTTVVEKTKTKANNYFNIGRVSTIIPTKIPDNIMDVFKNISLPNQKIRFAMYGTGEPDYIDWIRQKAYKYPEIELVIDTDPDVTNKYRNLDAFVYWLPKESTESFGLVIIEAMLSGVPVIAHRAGAIPEIIKHGQNGFLFDDLGEIQSYIQIIAEDEQVRKQIIYNAKQTVLNRFTHDIMASNYRKLYYKVISQWRT